MSKKVVVVGGGFTGVAAAVCAARNGMEVTLVEQSNSLGGASTVNLVNPFMPYWTKDEQGQKEYLSTGFFEELTVAMKEIGILAQNECDFSEESLKLLLNRMVLNAGVRLLFNCVIIESKILDGKIQSVTAFDSGKRIELEADYFIDATGDGNLFALSDVPFEIGRPEDKLCQPMTLCFRLGNLKPERFPEKIHAFIHNVYKDYCKKGKITIPRENVLFFRTLLPTVLHFNTTRVVKMDPINPWDVTRAEIQAREQIEELVDMFRKEVPGFEEAVVFSTASRIGVRESRRMVGQYQINAEDMKSCTIFKDSIAVGNYDIDIHNPSGVGTSHYYFANGTYYTIPYRTLVPLEGPDNLIVAGRCISATHEAQASLRIMPICCCLGHAAGAATVVANQHRSSYAEAPIAEIQELLEREGARIR